MSSGGPTEQQIPESWLRKIRSTVWQSAIVCSLAVGGFVYALSRSDIEGLRYEIRNRPVNQLQIQQVDRPKNEWDVISERMKERESQAKEREQQKAGPKND